MTKSVQGQFSQQSRTSTRLATLAHRNSRKRKYVEQSEDDVRQHMGEDGLRIYRWFKEKGYHIDIASLEREWGYRMTRFDEYLNTVKLAPAA